MWNYYNPVDIIFGANKFNDLSSILNKKKYVIVTHPEDIFQKYLANAKLESKFTPKINFCIDDTFDEAEKISKLLLDKKVLKDLGHE